MSCRTAISKNLFFSTKSEAQERDSKHHAKGEMTGECGVGNAVLRDTKGRTNKVMRG
jgi:hypothetical protein